MSIAAWRRGLWIAGVLLATVLVSAQNERLPNELVSLLPAKAADVDGLWMVQPPLVSGEVTGVLPGRENCDGNPPSVHIKIRIMGVTGEHAATLLPMRKQGWAREWERKKQTLPVDSKVETTGSGELAWSESRRGCIESSVGSVMVSSAAAHLQRGSLAYFIDVGGEQTGAETRALALDILSRAAKIDLPLAQR